MERVLYFEDNKVYGVYVTDFYFIKVDLNFYYGRSSSPWPRKTREGSELFDLQIDAQCAIEASG